jgi:tetratricopeptide (TPR) repeat protein
MNLRHLFRKHRRGDQKPYTWPKPLWKKVLFFPLDACYFHVDLLRNAWEFLRWICFTRPKCFYCNTKFNAGLKVKRNLPANRYTNLWLARLLCPCTKAPDHAQCATPFCLQVKRKPLRVIPMTMATLLLWAGVGFAAASYPPARRLARRILPDQTTQQLKRLMRPATHNPLERARTMVTEKNFLEARIAYMNAVRVDPSNSVVRAEFADTLLELRLWAQALNQLQATTLLNPSNELAVTKFVSLAMLTRHAERALPAAENLAAARPELAKAKLLLASSYSATEQLPKALEILHSLKTHPGLTAEEALQAGNLAVNTLRDHPLARHLYARSVTLEHANLHAHIQLAKIDRLAGRRKASHTALEQAAAIDQGHYEVFAEQAEHHLLEGKLNLALSTMKQAYDRNPNWAYAKARLAEMMILAGRFDEAKRLADELTEKPMPRNEAMGHTVLAQIYLKKHLYPSAIREAEAAIQLDGNFYRQFSILAEARLAQGEHDASRAALDQALVLEPGHIEVRVVEAQLAYAQKDPARGLARLNVIATETNLPPAIVMKLASLAYAHRQYEPAREWFDRLHRANPGDAIATHGLVQANRMLGLDPDRTRDLAEGLSQRFPESVDFALSYAKSLVEEEPIAASLPKIEQIAAHFAFNPAAHFYLGKAYFLAERFAEARKELEATLEMAPRFSESTEIKALLERIP